MLLPAATFALGAALTVVLCRRTAPPELFRRRPTLIAAGLLAILLPLGQAAQNPHALYPFVHWTMYSSADRSDHKEYVAEDEHGRRFLYPFASLAFSSPWAVMARLDDLIARCSCAAGDPLVDRALASLADLHSARTGVGIVRIQAYDRWAEDHAAERHAAYTWTQPGDGGPARR